MYYLYEKQNIDDATIELSFLLAEKIQSQCIAFDFIFQNGLPLLIEISYGFLKEVYDPCIGYWDKNLHWYDGKFDPCEWMVINVCNDK